ncbi:MAG TPA: hypothetical protein VHX86_15010 [Tepidisphaeraceae bacterium]|nr:hypothetical protein [Tepidisphaeraceae bacterium]
MRISKFRPEFLLLLIVALTALRPGDGPWVNDEAIMMEMAIRYNGTASDLYGFHLPFTPCPYGLQGTRGARYGPLPVWIDQILLGFTHRVVAILACRAVLFTSITALALYWLTRTLRLSAWFAVITMLSPWLWLLSRSLWDSTWCIPISAVLVAAYAAFLASPSAIALCLTLLCCIVLPLVHLTGVAIVLPIGLHLLVFHRQQLLKWKWSLTAISLLCIYLFWPYLAFVFAHTQPHIPRGGSPLLGWLFPLLGGHYLTLGVAGTMPGDGWQDHAPKILQYIFAAVQWIARIALAAVWLGMALAVPRAWHTIRRPEDADPIQHLCLIALLVWICQTFLDGIERLYFGPQYCAATWMVYVFFAWIAVGWLTRRSAESGAIVRWLAGIYSVSLLLGILIIAVTIARNAGTAGGYYGTSLGNQIEAVKQIRRFSNQSDIDIRFTPWQLHPLAYQVLMELNPAAPGPLPAQHLLVKYRNAYPGDARIEVLAVSR